MPRPERLLARHLRDGGVAGLSLDVFDTLVLRPSRPEILRFGAIAGHQHRALVEAGWQSPGVSALWRSRLRCHKAAYDQRRVGGPEPRHHDILIAMCPPLALPMAAVEVLAAAEVAYETAIARPNRRLLRLLDNIDLPMVLTSDMYLPAAALARIVAAACPRLAGAPVVVSAEHGTSKRAGPLFDIAVARLGLTPDRVVHVGDDPLADVTRARERGLTALHWPRPLPWRLAHRAKDRLARAVMRRMGWIASASA
ncbi:HAD hydrolase-like protein [Magnetospirillum gryphiswaldense]|uniref:HAD hydrolase-like protein n=1 Tax=Magnetospirillum gryphiswaldense TaxID=55518 RepID=UPI000D21902C|nr:HAD hydrolase-like protein [Magnetospirillum gryphiswaldense]AVM76367.1 hypothetical protein MSR1_39140 [Magnetospirillum gryphiswaldense MSR-1]AVM80270.1 hypothetical protein MSR1L_39140 [Magnetospirillum gryphiswaldense]